MAACGATGAGAARGAATKAVKSAPISRTKEGHVHIHIERERERETWGHKGHRDMQRYMEPVRTCIQVFSDR